MSVLVNLDTLGITPEDIKIIIAYLTIDTNKNTILIKKVLKLGRYIKK